MFPMLLAAIGEGGGEAAQQPTPWFLIVVGVAIVAVTALTWVVLRGGNNST